MTFDDCCPRPPSAIVWLTGLPCAGKTTIAQVLVSRLLQTGRRAENLDGDVLRSALWENAGFSRKDRDLNVARIAYIARLLARNGVVAVVSAVSPYRAARDSVRSQSGWFIEVYVECPLEICIARDVKGMYRKALDGQIKGFTGVDDPYEPPPHPEVSLRTDLEDVSSCVENILRAIPGAACSRR